jgi:hypothetical protein
MRYSARAEVLYLDRAGRYKTEKPYEVAFDAAAAGINIASTNLSLVRTEISIYDASPTRNEFSLAEHGFQLMEDRTELDPEDFADVDKITSTYYDEMKESVKRVLGRPVELFVVNHRVRNESRSE